jgi:hypothetical protein
MEALRSSETLVPTRATRRSISEDGILHISSFYTVLNLLLKNCFNLPRHVLWAVKWPDRLCVLWRTVKSSIAGIQSLQFVLYLELEICRILSRFSFTEWNTRTRNLTEYNRICLGYQPRQMLIEDRNFRDHNCRHHMLVIRKETVPKSALFIIIWLEYIQRSCLQSNNKW